MVICDGHVMYLFIINFLWGGGRRGDCVEKKGLWEFVSHLGGISQRHAGVGLYRSLDDPEVRWAWALQTCWTTWLLLL